MLMNWWSHLFLMLLFAVLLCCSVKRTEGHHRCVMRKMVQEKKKVEDSGGAPCIRRKDRGGRWKLKPHWYCLSWQGLIASLIFDSKVAPFSNTHTSRDGGKTISANNIRDGFIQLRISSSRWCHSPAYPQPLSGFCCDKNCRLKRGL